MKHARTQMQYRFAVIYDTSSICIEYILLWLNTEKDIDPHVQVYYTHRYILYIYIYIYYIDPA